MPPVCTRAALSAAPVSGSGAASVVSSFRALRINSKGSSAAFSSCARSSSAGCCGHKRHSQFASSCGSRPCLSLSAGRSYLSASSTSSFSTTAARPTSDRRRAMREWFNKAGAKFKPTKADRDGTGAHQLQPLANPFPLNPLFRSRPVLGEDTRELVWQKVVQQGQSIKAVAAELSIDMRRVAAVVRLKEVEKAWIAEGKPLAKPYAQAVLSMLPQNNYGPDEPVQPHEPINEIHAHGYTMQQLFVPVSESRHFTREDAARAFHPTLLSADKRVPIPELITLERDVLAGQRTPEESFQAFRDATAAEQKALAQRNEAAAAAERARTSRVETDRFEFRIHDFNAEDVGRKGRSPHAVGWRYGVPFHDRKRGQVKIPTSVG